MLGLTFSDSLILPSDHSWWNLHRTRTMGLPNPGTRCATELEFCNYYYYYYYYYWEMVRYVSCKNGRMYVWPTLCGNLYVDILNHCSCCVRVCMCVRARARARVCVILVSLIIVGRNPLVINVSNRYILI